MVVSVGRRLFVTGLSILCTGILLMSGAQGSGIKPVARIDGVPLRMPHETPAILKVNLGNHQVHAGDLVRASVVTSSNVASVEARIQGYGMALQHVGVGRFEFNYQVPWLPFFLKGSWPVNVIARNIDGVATQRVLYIQYQ